jgi:hypothetical protein
LANIFARHDSQAGAGEGKTGKCFDDTIDSMLSLIAAAPL